MLKQFFFWKSIHMFKCGHSSQDLTQITGCKLNSHVTLNYDFFPGTQNEMPLLYIRTLRTQAGIVCVLGERWCVLMTITVMMMEAMTKIMVKSMYLPMSGTALEVEGINSTITSKNTVRESRTEMLRVIFSPRQNQV